VYGITYGAADGLAGGWAEKLYLKPGTRVVRLEGVSDEAFMAGGCSLPTALHAVERAAILLTDTVLVLGSGPVGLSAIILSRMAGAGTVLCIGAPDHRLDAAKRVGAAAVLNFERTTSEQRQSWVLEHTAGRGADVTIEATGNPQAVTDALRFTRDAGRAVIVGQYTDHGEVALNPHTDLNRKHLDVRAVWGSDYSHFHRAVRVMHDAQRAHAWSLLPMKRYDLTHANEALDDVASGRIIKALIEPQR
jgi:L-iditol 2-dehydrogenase